ncbi:DUF2786 domain-containing protein [Neisseria leonii]|uniref:DUF2786 domain-containing protein n=1 Tax=Neisseria leonii TaxID=2995413 RepID=UPI00237BFAAE|nr:DUF2786 domain-containing protein [Neisseria sp. 3986]MDD9325639.1 DUF2786 domain-containing protein [Neisseria sp. 3986]
MDEQKALAKIRKCLALSRSANEHEAALALKQAQALMRQYGISDADVALSDIGESAGSKYAAVLPRWQAELAATVCACFGVRCYTDQQFGGALLKFYGVGNKAELADYAYNVLLRQLKTLRRGYMATVLKRVCLAKNKTYRADAFCSGWVQAVRSKIDVFANGERETALLAQWHEHQGLTKGRTCTTKPGSGTNADNDRAVGWVTGKNAQLHHAVGAEAQQTLGKQP